MVDLKSIWAMQKPEKDELIIKTKIDNLPQFNCFAATNHITGNHLYIMELSSNTIIPEFKNFKSKGVRIEVFEFKESKELNIYLIDNELKDIFSLFIENIIEEISSSATEIEAIEVSSNVIHKWKKLFDKITFTGLTLEQQKGLLGELVFFNELLNNHFAIERILESWTGPDFEDKDFTFGSICIEVKFSISKIPRIKITSERQLDISNIEKLYLNHYSSEILKENGISLNSLITDIRGKISHNKNSINQFNDRLELIGYFDDDSENYNLQYGIKKWSLFEVKNNFPKLTRDNIPSGIYDTSYYIENSALDQYSTDFNTILQELI